MTARWFKLSVALLLLISTQACNEPTYSKEKVTESIIDLCKNEYDLDVDVKITGTTLGVLIPIEGLVDLELKLDKTAGEKIEDVALSIHRVMMSSNSPLKIYTLVARDTKSTGAEFVLTGNVYDVVRVRLFDISRGEYHKRILRDFRFNPGAVGEAKIKELFEALNENADFIQNLKPLFYPIYSIGKNGSQKIDVIEMLSKEISPQEALFYVKTKEFYEPMPGFEAYRAIFPPGFSNEYLTLVNMSMFPNPVKEIVPKYFYSGTEIRQRNLQETFDQYQDQGYIAIDGFPKRELTLDWFLSQQIARRIKMSFAEDKKLSWRFTVNDCQGLSVNKILGFRFSIASNKPEAEDNQIIFSRILKLSAVVLHRYSFEDFEGIELTDTRPGGKKIYLSKEDLERFRRNKIKIKDLI
ncbi:MAG: hypothetical protein KKD90_01720 [Candidatus Omnitrophica bacterium]|nr:hypothetical protein [Candidatus Omnitrophota bacterium]